MSESKTRNYSGRHSTCHGATLSSIAGCTVRRIKELPQCKVIVMNAVNTWLDACRSATCQSGCVLCVMTRSYRTQESWHIRCPQHAQHVDCWHAAAPCARHETGLAHAAACLTAGAGTPYAMHDIDQASMYTRSGHSFHMQEPSKQLPDKVSFLAKLTAPILVTGVLSQH